MVKLFIVGFPRDMEEIELNEMFSMYGTVNSVKIITEKESGKSLGYGFIMMDDDTGADRAIAAMNGATIDEREISVRVAEDKRSNTAKIEMPAVNRSSSQLYDAKHRGKRPRR